MPVDEEESEEGGIDYLDIYHWIWVMHLGNALAVFMNQHFPRSLGIMKYAINTFMMLFTIVVIIRICMVFFAAPEEDMGESSEDTGGDGGETNDGGFLRQIPRCDSRDEGYELCVELQRVRSWYALEVLYFMANITSNVFFIMLRFCSGIRIIGSRPKTIVTKDSDMIEEQ